QILEDYNCKIRILEMIGQQIDSALARFLDPTYGAATFAEFAAKRLGVELAVSDFGRGNYEEAQLFAFNKSSRTIPTNVMELLDGVNELYFRKEVEFPVQAAMASFMAERAAVQGQSKYNREGLYTWARVRYPQAADELTEEEFRTQSKAKLNEKLLALSHKYY